MKALYITGHVVVRSLIEEMLNQEKVKRYDIFPHVLFFSADSNPRMDTSVWPGHNVAFFVLDEDEVIESILNKLKMYNESVKFALEKIEAYSFSIQSSVK